MPRQQPPQPLEKREYERRMIGELEERLARLHVMADPTEPSRAEIATLEARLVGCYASAEDSPIRMEQPSLTVVAHQIVWLDEAEFYCAHGDAHLYGDDHCQGDELLDWARGRIDRDAVRLSSEASRLILHDFICHVTKVAPETLHIGGGIATLDDGRQVLEARLPAWANPLGRRRDHHDVAREIESSTYAEFRRWLRRFDDGAIVGWAGSTRDCVIHRYFRQRTGARWDCLRINLDTASVESESSYATVTSRLPEFAAFVSRVTTGTRCDPMAEAAPITASWLRRQLPEVWPEAIIPRFP